MKKSPHKQHLSEPIEQVDSLSLVLRQRYLEKEWCRLRHDEATREEHLAIEKQLQERSTWARKHPQDCVEGASAENGIRTLRYRRVKERYGPHTGKYQWIEQTEERIEGVFTIISDKQTGAVEAKSELQDIITSFVGLKGEAK